MALYNKYLFLSNISEIQHGWLCSMCLFWGHVFHSILMRMAEIRSLKVQAYLKPHLFNIEHYIGQSKSYDLKSRGRKMRPWQLHRCLTLLQQSYTSEPKGHLPQMVDEYRYASLNPESYTWTTRIHI